MLNNAVVSASLSALSEMAKLAPASSQKPVLEL
jgi:hypothetical protein